MLQVHLAALSLLLSAPAELAKGMVVSCPGMGETWGEPEMQVALQELKQLGTTWVELHPYAGVETDGRIRFRPAAQTRFLGRGAAFVKASGLSLYWVPHLAYWGRFDWRGTINFGKDQEAWARFFEGYQAFIVDQAKFAESVGAPMFAVGLEYEATMDHEAEWRRIIAAVRAVYRGQLVYAANWNGLDRVRFWDAVDLIGVQGYFPLAKGSNPSDAELRAAWDRPLLYLAELSQAYQKPVLFNELGYARSKQAAVRPWEPANDDSSEAIELRRRLLAIGLERVQAAPFVRGVFLWKWIPGRAFFDRDFSMRDPEAQAVLQRYWKNQ